MARAGYSKYHAVRTEVYGMTFASKKEAKRYLDLKLLERAGEIMFLKTQVPYKLIDKSQYGREIRYIADFVYFDPKKRKTVVEDTKGVRTDVYKLKKRLLAERYGIEIVET